MSGESARLARRAWGIALFVTLLGLAALFAPPPGRAAASVHGDAAANARAGLAAPLRFEHAPLRRALPTTPFTLPASSASPELVVFPPQTGANVARPVAVMLHGMCGAPESTCAPIAHAVTKDRWLVCPRATTACDGGGAAWSMRDAAAQIEASVARLAAIDPAHVDAGADRTLIGFSFGATIAVSVVNASANDRARARAKTNASTHDARWSRVILLGADVAPDAATMRRAGVDRVLLGAGDYDMMHDRMSAAADHLQRAGAAARFVSLGSVGHSYAYDMDAWMTRALAWVESAAPAPPPDRTSAADDTM